MIKGNCPCRSIVKMWLIFILGNLSPIFWNASVLRIVMAFMFRVLRKTDQKTAKNDLEWWMHEVMGVVCGAMFGEERVNNSVDLLSRVLVAFWVGQISALFTYSYALLLQLAVTDAWMLLNLQSRTPRVLSFRDEPTLRRFCTLCRPMFVYVVFEEPWNKELSSVSLLHV